MTGLVRWTGTPSWWNYVGRIGMAVLFGCGATALLVTEFEHKEAGSVMLLLVAIAFFLSACWSKFSNRFTVSDSSVSATYGLLSQETHEIDVQDIQDLVLRQSLMGRIFNYGTIEFSSAGRDAAEVIFAGVPDPKSVKQLVSDLKHQIPRGQV
ncbi:MAG TPA: PH domain-containing protein [Candidatus Binatia bacterium]|nr:PH domain-containing protein [Candidatus Binatia bacterium]